MRLIPSLFALTLSLAALPASAAELQLWRLDCGSIAVKDLNAFSDTMAYSGQSKTLTDSCYLIRHNADYMLWDTGLPAGLLGAPQDPDAAMAPTLAKDLPTQLAEINVTSAQIGRVGISHYHFDHVGQLASFPGATLMIGAADIAVLKQEVLPAFADPAFFEPWLKGDSKLDPVTGDRDVFGDGSVMMLAMPGHTPGESALLVNLADKGPVLLSGDVVHFEEQIANDGVPGFNADRADSLASMKRMEALADNLNATLVIQHDASHIDRLPAFPQAAD